MIFFNEGTITFVEQRDQNESGKLAYSLAFISGLIDCDRFRKLCGFNLRHQDAPSSNTKSVLGRDFKTKDYRRKPFFSILCLISKLHNAFPCLA